MLLSNVVKSWTILLLLLMRYSDSQRDNYGNNHLAIKIDMSKTYDRVKWAMIKFMMEKAVFNEKWVKWIGEYMDFVSYKVLKIIILGVKLCFREVKNKQTLSPLSCSFCGLRAYLPSSWKMKEITRIHG